MRLGHRAHGVEYYRLLLLLLQHLAASRRTLEVHSLVVALFEERFARLTSTYEWWLPILVICHINLVDQSGVFKSDLPAGALCIDLSHRVVERE